MFGTLGGPELLLILIIALIVFGPRKLPEIGKSLGKMMVEFRRASNDFKRTLEDEVEAEKLRTAIEPAHVDLSPPPAMNTETASPPDSVPYGGSDGYSDESAAEPDKSTAEEPAPSPGAPPAPPEGVAAVESK